MFTGIIRHLGIIKSILHHDNYSSITVFVGTDNIIKIGDSICINGICLTVVSISQDNFTFTFNVIKETKLKTTFNIWKENDEVNIELSLKNERFDGHIVSGHVDCISELLEIKDNIYFFKTPEEISSLIVDKGSISVDGVSLTISTCFNNIFTVSLIPHTINWTIFKNYKLGCKVNLEADYRLKTHNQYYGDIYNMFDKYILSDEHAISIALTLSEKGLYSAPPNPHVGCIITKNKKIIGMGYHSSPGNPHAEIEAFNNANLNGYTSFEDCELYVTLEPCCHNGKTGKCTDRIIKEKIKRVIIGVCDTDKRVIDKGVNILRDEGIDVCILNDKNVINSLTPYLYQRKNEMPYVYIKSATTLDNKCVDKDDNSKWITCEKSRQDSHINLRAKVQCIITSYNTVIKDHPQLNIRENIICKQPLIAVLDRHEKLTQEDIKKCGWKNYIIWKRDYISLLNELYVKYNTVSVLFECGPTLTSKLINERVYNELHLYISPSIIRGGLGITQSINTSGLLEDKFSLGEIIECKIIDKDIKVVIKNEDYSKDF